MKTALLFLLFPAAALAPFAEGRAQALESVVVSATELASEGDGGGELIWTLGELMVEFYANGPALDQGFLQYEFLINAIAEPGLDEPLAWQLSLWPNPLGEGQLNVASSEALQIILFDGMGRQLLKAQCGATVSILDLSSFPAGSFWLLALDSEGGSRAYQVQKR